ncbi:NAD-dependent succinate-semialdehyde dehydrogenase [Acinetobacter schindleri]|jgi:succinate-semialdehyde dehydrogenase/glutarate-semialdehyde dehydrogenase|uniref:NAD-dependent succinate-semialdehyde dehydrogenase n=1 Tax=Acinetobacter TaxID=469 RepID=UPI00066262C6|nr:MULTISPECIES: NAD-dependent succinate-semialdehyde dehydrogenase [Acinetobacter]KMV01023.1 succinate-semialdehyde dehydrogenase [Acinetobacter sp. VT 511]MCU4324322.1 NAD-dependent succinate-semialdehyde dehydrogenase [Acinetobacter schindleri]PUR00625.1 NAD-dependent succinate-semialdehyde dehydrogenase [Acinetobacter schindleri]
MAYQSINPFTNQKLKDYPPHTDEHIQNALDQAEQILKSDWPQQIDQRIKVLRNVAQKLREQKTELAKLMTLDMGKLIKQSEGEIESCAKIAEYFADQAKEFLAPVSYETELGEAWVEHHPLGIVMAVEPWNFPFYQLMRVFAPNCAIGNPVLAKHAGIVPQCAEAFEKLVLEAGAPRGVWINLFISSDQVQEIIADPRVQGVALTGSEGAGSAVAEQAGKYIKKSTLELGGNDVFIVLDDADLEKAIKIGCQARVNNSGQVCTAAKRFILHEKIADEFKAGMLKAFQELKIGDPLDPETTLAPLSSADALEKLTKQVDKAVAHGATVLTGGKPIEHAGNFYEPTILENISRDNPAWYEEFFGPVAQIYVAKDEDEIVSIANDSHYGLGGVIHSQDIERAKKLASRVETGMIWINWFTDTAPELPFGGIKNSGYGHELSIDGFREFTQKRLVVVKSPKE